MANIFEEHPAKSIITYTLLVMGSTWAFSTFILDENKVNFYKAQVSNEQAVVRQLEAKISVLENKNAELASDNAMYRKWLEGEPKSFPALTKHIETLEITLAKKEEVILDGVNKDKDHPTPVSVEKKYVYAQEFVKGQSFTDSLTGATIGVSTIYSDNSANAYVFLPGEGGEEIRGIKPGMTWVFGVNDRTFKLTMNRIEWIGSQLEATVLEL
ncbi:hypothetical protein [Vibrio splendidus]|uniref:hypothetical protein n=1 Tax=Vibrio splendidus TaxID=29497 RepID=UPI000C818224|nr:hypothetical protein [Vibrio splendidus]PMG60792.1 hypothetical protein BCU89_26035 [Vibrio splendidus]